MPFVHYIGLALLLPSADLLSLPGHLFPLAVGLRLSHIDRFHVNFHPVFGYTIFLARAVVARGPCNLPQASLNESLTRK